MPAISLFLEPCSNSPDVNFNPIDPPNKLNGEVCLAVGLGYM